MVPGTHTGGRGDYRGVPDPGRSTGDVPTSVPWELWGALAGGRSGRDHVPTVARTEEGLDTEGDWSRGSCAYVSGSVKYFETVLVRVRTSL